MRPTVPVVQSPVGLWLCPPLPGGPGVSTALDPVMTQALTVENPVHTDDLP